MYRAKLIGLCSGIFFIMLLWPAYEENLKLVALAAGLCGGIAVGLFCDSFQKKQDQEAAALNSIIAVLHKYQDDTNRSWKDLFATITEQVNILYKNTSSNFKWVASSITELDENLAKRMQAQHEILQNFTGLVQSSFTRNDNQLENLLEHLSHYQEDLDAIFSKRAELENQKAASLNSIIAVLNKHQDDINRSWTDLFATLTEKVDILHKNTCSNFTWAVSSITELDKNIEKRMLAQHEVLHNLANVFQSSITRNDNKLASLLEHLNLYKREMDDIFSKRVEQEYQLTVEMKNETIKTFQEIGRYLDDLNKLVDLNLQVKETAKNTVNKAFKEGIEDITRAFEDSVEDMGKNVSRMLEKINDATTETIGEFNRSYSQIEQVVSRQKEVHLETLESTRQLVKEMIDINQKDSEIMERMLNAC